MGKPVDYVKLSISVFVISFLFFYAIQLVAAALIFFGGGKEHFWDHIVNAGAAAVNWFHDAGQWTGEKTQWLISHTPRNQFCKGDKECEAWFDGAVCAAAISAPGGALVGRAMAGNYTLAKCGVAAGTAWQAMQ